MPRKHRDPTASSRIMRTKALAIGVVKYVVTTMMQQQRMINTGALRHKDYGRSDVTKGKLCGNTMVAPFAGSSRETALAMASCLLGQCLARTLDNRLAPDV